MAANGIFCLETQWGAKLTDRSSVEPQLRMLENLGVAGGVIHRDVATVEEFEHYLKTWLQKHYARFSVGYLAFHGSRGRIWAGSTDLSLDDLAQVIDGRGDGRTLYLGSCSTLAAPEAELLDFCASTKVRALVGYTRQIEWLESAALDVILLPELLRSADLKRLHARLKKDHPRFVDGLGLRIATAQWATGRTPAVHATGS